MKQKLYSLVLLTSLFTLSGIASITAAETTETTTQAEATTVESTTEITTSEDVTIEESTTVQPIITKKIKKTIKVGKTYSVKKKLKIKNTSLSDYSFTSSNNKVSIENGVVTGLKSGKATVTVTNENDQVVGKIKFKIKKNYTEEELKYMSSIIFCEAGGECYAGKLAVGIVVLNRMKSSLYPNDMKSVLYQRYQFTPTRNGAMAKALSMYDNGKLPKKCIKAAKEVLNGRTSVEYKSKTYDLNGFLFFSRYVPRAKLRIQHHMFK